MPVLGQRLGARGVGPYVASRPASPSCPCRTARPASPRRAAAPARTPGSDSRGSHSAASAGSARSAGTAACVIDSGQPWPASTCDQTRNPAARRRWPSGRDQASVSPADTRVAEQPVPGRVEVDLVDPVAVAVVGAQHRGGGVRLLAPALRLCGAGGPAQFAQLRRDLVERSRARRAARPPRSAPGRRRRRRTPTSGGTWLVTVWVGTAMTATVRHVQAADGTPPPAGGSRRTRSRPSCEGLEAQGGVAAAEGHRQLLRGVPDHRSGRRGRVLRPAVAAAAAARPGRRARLRRHRLGPTPSTTSASNILDRRPRPC